MAIDRLPSGLGLSGGSLFFTEETMPDSLRREHALPARHWAVLHAFEGSVTFVDLQADADRIIPAPDHIIIHPEVPHLLTGEGSFRCRMDFFREPDPRPPHENTRSLCGRGRARQPGALRSKR